ncbi:MAG: hypothetical protein IJN59_05490, partial [Oscillospiraceae bacterium]|nr:hypothetical protein [Oscillospiraceae bacterium]
MIKKLFATVLALTMVLTFGFTAVAAETATYKAVPNPASVYQGDVFTIDVLVTNQEQITASAIKIEFDASKIQPVDSEGKALVADKTTDAWTALVNTPPADKMSAKYTKAGTIQFGLGSLTSVGTIPANDVVFSVRFKALDNAKGDMGVTVTMDSFGDGAGAALAVENQTDATFTVQEMPNKPTLATDVTIDGTVAFGETVSAKYTFNNGNKSGTTTDADASKITWTVAGEVVKEATADEDKTLKIDNTDWVAEKVAVKVEPIADRAANLNAVGA